MRLMLRAGKLIVRAGRALRLIPGVPCECCDGGAYWILAKSCPCAGLPSTVLAIHVRLLVTITREQAAAYPANSGPLITFRRAGRCFTVPEFVTTGPDGRMVGVGRPEYQVVNAIPDGIGEAGALLPRYENCEDAACECRPIVLLQSCGSPVTTHQPWTFRERWDSAGPNAGPVRRLGPGNGDFTGGCWCVIGQADTPPDSSPPYVLAPTAEFSFPDCCTCVGNFQTLYAALLPCAPLSPEGLAKWQRLNERKCCCPAIAGSWSTSFESQYELDITYAGVNGYRSITRRTTVERRTTRGRGVSSVRTYSFDGIRPIPEENDFQSTTLPAEPLGGPCVPRETGNPINVCGPFQPGENVAVSYSATCDAIGINVVRTVNTNDVTIVERYMASSVLFTDRTRGNTCGGERQTGLATFTPPNPLDLMP